MYNYNFTRNQAESLMGKRFKTLVEWDGVLPGASGQVVWTSGSTVWSTTGPYERYEIVIAWELTQGDPRRAFTKQGRFSKFQVGKYLREVPA